MFIRSRIGRGLLTAALGVAGLEAAVAEVGITYAREQARDLIARGAPGVHLYTLNKAEAVLSIVSGLVL